MTEHKVPWHLQGAHFINLQKVGREAQEAGTSGRKAYPGLARANYTFGANLHDQKNPRALPYLGLLLVCRYLCDGYLDEEGLKGLSMYDRARVGCYLAGAFPRETQSPLMSHSPHGRRHRSAAAIDPPLARKCVRAPDQVAGPLSWGVGWPSSALLRPEFLI